MDSLTEQFNEIQRKMQKAGGFTIEDITTELIKSVRIYNKAVVVKTLGIIEEIDDSQDEMSLVYNAGIRMQNSLIKRVQQTQEELI